MELTWLGHSCFRIEECGHILILDPYQDNSIPGLGAITETADAVLCTHDHFDHGYRQAVHLKEAPTPVPYTLTLIDSFHDDVEGSKRGQNQIIVLDFPELRIVHLGDLGCLLTQEQCNAIGQVDVLLLPIGGTYTINAAEAKQTAKMLNPTVTIPMHYRSEKFGFPEIGTLADYVMLCDDVVYYPTNRIELSKHTKKQTAVLKYQR